MRGWLSECTKSHTKCRIQRIDGNEFRGPLRLLELKEDSIVLRENAEDVEYACLSHCWGENPVDTIKTTEQTLESFKEGITESNLPANFRDAIDVCRALDVKYLWIDSLCIIQDQKDNRDWNDEAAKMAEIYENAHVTIATTRSANAHGGCYSKRHPKHLAEPVPGYEGVFASVEPPGMPVEFKRSDIPLNLPLLERGWVYQEMRLSRRVLHFCDEQVVWICETSRRSESKCHDGTIDHYFKAEKAYSYEHMPYGIPSSNPKLLWYRWVHEYSRLQLTCPNKDRMAALAGLAKRMQNFHNMGRYLSGIWETSLIFDLGWFTELRPNTNSEEISANDLVTAPTYPSWSWASVKTPIRWASDASSLRPLARLTQINCVADGPVHMGSLKPSSSITIQTRATKDSCLSQAPVQDTVIKDVEVLKYRPDRNAQEPQAETGGLLLFVTVSAFVGLAQAIHVKLRSDGETYERVGFAHICFVVEHEEIELDESEEDEEYGSEEDLEYDSDISLWDREPWNTFPLMELTLV